MRGLYQRNGIFWARFKVRGHEYRESLRTRSKAVAERRLKAVKEHIEETAYFGGSDPVGGGRGRLMAWRMGAARAQAADSRPLHHQPRPGPPWLDGKSVHEIDLPLLKEVVRGRSKHGASNATIRRDMTAISSVLGHCVDEGWIEENPAHMMDRSRFKERKAKIILPRPESLARVFAEAGRLIDMAAFSLETGMRQEEIAGLERDRVDRARMSVTLEDTKGNAVREVPLSPRALAIIDRQPQFFSSPWVFWRGAGERFANVDSDWYAKTQRIAQKAAQEGAAFKRFRFHDLRHLFAVRYLRDRRGSIYDLKEILGHESVKTTERYLDHLTPDERQWAMHGAAQNPAHKERFEAENG
jgi:integrase/recombinase XerD